MGGVQDTSAAMSGALVRGWLEGIAQLAPFSLHEVPGLTMWSVQQAVRLLSWWLKTLRRSVPRNPGKSSEASEELTFKALGCPFCHILLTRAIARPVQISGAEEQTLLPDGGSFRVIW